MRVIKFRHYFPSTGVVTAGHDLMTLILTATGKEDFWKEAVWMQYTGLKDKNGLECYEGDKVTNSLTAHHGQVIFSDEYACFSVVDISGRWVCSMGAMHSDGFEITGNIYEDKRK